MNESIFCETFRKPIAHMNQIRTLPETVSLPTASTWACTSSSEMAKAGWQNRQERVAIISARNKIFLNFFKAPPYKESGLAIKEPTMLVNRRRHQAFIISRKICPPSIRHQDFQMFDVVWLAPIEKATGAV
jgi:hypothetical protein